MKRLKKDDMVVVTAGKDRGRQGKILGFSHEGQRVLVEKLNMVKRHTRPSQANQLGGIVEKEAGIHISNVMLLTAEGNPTRVQFKVRENGIKARYSAKYDTFIDA
jgi:large subunit ribosomal protein L24